MTFLVASMLATAMLSFLRGKPLENYAALSSASTDDISLFFVTPSLVRVHGDLLYVYDSADETIKILDSKTNNYVTENSHYRAKTDDILFFENIMLIFSKEDASIIARERTEEGFKEFDFNFSSLTTLESCKSLHVVALNGVSYLLLCPENIQEGTFEIAKLTKSEDESEITLSDYKSFTPQSAPISNYTASQVAVVDEKIAVFFANSSSIVSISLDPTGDLSSVGQAISVGGIPAFEAGETILSLSMVNYPSPCLALSTNKNIMFYNIVSNQSITEDASKKIALDDDFNLVDISGADSIIGLVSKEMKALKYYILSGDEPTCQTKVNEAIELVINGEESFDYRHTSEEITMLKTPFGNPSEPSDVVATITADSDLAIIGYGKYQSTGEAVHGWDYCMYSSGTSNYYGYVFNFPLRDLEDTTTDQTYITVQPNTIVYSLPSTNLDPVEEADAGIKNTIVARITSPSSTRLKILSTVFDYSFTSGNREVKFFRVGINEDGSQVGYIDRDMVRNTTSITDRIIPNATVMKDNSQIFVEKDSTSDVIMTLNKNHRVKVIGKRDTISNLTHVKFNDQEGNEIEGYIYTYNLEADSWNMVQMIGILLIAINVILLIVIVCIKNRVTR